MESDKKNDQIEEKKTRTTKKSFVEKRGQIQELFGIIFAIICFLSCIITGLVFYQLEIGTKINNLIVFIPFLKTQIPTLTINIPLIVVIAITVLFCVSLFLFYSEKDNIIKESNSGTITTTQGWNFIDELKKEAELENNNLSFQHINFNYLPKHIETIRFFVGAFFILGLTGSFSGIAEVVAKVILSLTAMGDSSSGGNIDLAKALITIKDPLQPLKTVFLVTILGLGSALVVENFLQILYKKISTLEDEISKSARKEVIELCNKKTKLLSEIDTKLGTLIQKNSENFESLENTLKNQNETLITGLKTSGEEFIKNFNENSIESFNAQVKLFKSLKDLSKLEFSTYIKFLREKSGEVSTKLLNILDNQNSTYQIIKKQMEDFYNTHNNALLGNEQRNIAHFDELKKQNQDLVDKLKNTANSSLKEQEKTLTNLKNLLEADLNKLFSQLDNKTGEIKNELLANLEKQKAFYEQANTHQKIFYNEVNSQQKKLYGEQDKILEKHDKKLDSYYKEIDNLHNRFLTQVNNKINIINSNFETLNNNLNPIIIMLEKSGSLLLNVENNIAGLGNRNESILNKLNEYLKLTESAINNNKDLIDNSSIFLSNQKKLLDNLTENIKRLNELSNTSTEYQRKIEDLRTYYKMHLNNNNHSGVIS